MKQNTNCYEILLNYNCNAKCLYCSQGSFDKSLNASFDMVAREIYLAKRKNFARLGFSGGEPTVSPYLVKAVKLAKNIGFNFIRIQTNGIRLSDYNFCQELAEAGLTFCKFSFMSDKPEIHDKLVGVPGAFRNAMEGVKNLKKLKIRLGNNIVVNKYNYKNLKKIIEFLLDKGISNFVVIYPIYTGSMSKNYKDLGISLLEVSEYFLKAIEFMASHDMSNEILFLNVPPCFLPGYENNAIGMEHFNTVVSDPKGNVSDLDKTANSNKIKGDVCKNCIFNERCSGLDKAYVDIFGWTGIENVKRKYSGEGKKKEYFTDNERCMIEILKSDKILSTQEILEKAKNIPLCQDCIDGNAVLNAANKLIKRGIISKSFKKGKYYWKLEKVF